MPIAVGRQITTISILFFQEVLKLSKRNVRRQFPNVSKFMEQNFVRRRKELKISQTTLAERANVTRNCIQQLECYEHLPLPSTMFNLLEALGFSEEEAAEFWAEIKNAYKQDRALQEESAETQGAAR